MLDRQQKQRFAADGYVVVPGAVSREMLDAARREVARLLASEPPPAGHTGPHFYAPEDAGGVLRALLCSSPARAAAGVKERPRCCT